MSSIRMAITLRRLAGKLTRRLASPLVQQRVCIVGVGLSDGPVTPELSGVMLEAQSFRRALDDAGLEKDDISGLASAGYGGMHEVALAEYLGLTPVGAYAMAAQRHMHDYGTKPEQLASIAVQTREHAGRNPGAMYRDPITVDDVMSS